MEYKLSDGTKGTIDKSSVTVAEWRRFWNVSTPDTENDELLARVSGLSIERVSKLLLDDYRRLSDAFRRACLAPLDEPKN
jgi:hypothetical protein